MSINPAKAKTLSPESFVSLQDISRECSLSYQTLNYYSCLGLLTVRKRRGNKRLYVFGEVRSRLNKITKLKDAGYPLKVISSILKQEEEVKDELSRDLGAGQRTFFDESGSTILLRFPGT